MSDLRFDRFEYAINSLIARYESEFYWDTKFVKMGQKKVVVAESKGSLDVLVHEPAMEIGANGVVDKVLFLFGFLTSAILNN